MSQTDLGVKQKANQMGLCEPSKTKPEDKVVYPTLRVSGKEAVDLFQDAVGTVKIGDQLRITVTVEATAIRQEKGKDDWGHELVFDVVSIDEVDPDDTSEQKPTKKGGKEVKDAADSEDDMVEDSDEDGE